MAIPAIPVRAWLDEKFPGRWIGRRGPIEWPTRSPDLSPCDFFLWGYLKNIVYQERSFATASLKSVLRYRPRCVLMHFVMWPIDSNAASTKVASSTSIGFLILVNSTYK